MRKLVAATALAVSPCVASSAVPGLLAEYFDFVDTPLSDIPDLSGLVPDALLVVSNIDYSVTEGAWPGLDAARFTDCFAACFTGCIDIPADGAYTFAPTSDDGSRLWIDGVPVVDHGGAHSLSRKAGWCKQSGKAFSSKSRWHMEIPRFKWKMANQAAWVAAACGVSHF